MKNQESPESHSYKPLESYLRYLSTLSPDSIGDLRAIATENFRFVDPFNDVRTLEGALAVFRKMFDVVADPKFQILQTYGEAPDFVIEWTFHFQSRWVNSGKPSSFNGLSKISFDAQERLCQHIDYWDPALHFYEHLPLIGVVLRGIRRHISSTEHGK